MDEYVLRGNPGILKCHIPSFVADFVFVEAWIQNENVQLTSETSRDYGIKNTFSKQILLCDRI